MPEVPQYQTKFAGRPQAKFTPIGFQVPDIDPATATDKAIEGLSHVATKTIIGALKEKQVFIRQQEITKETNELMNDMSSFMTNLEENATSLREGNEPWSDVYGREWGKKTQEMQNRIDTMPPGKVRDTIQDYFAQDVGKRSVVIASEAEQREDRDFVDDIRSNISMAIKIGGEEGLDLLQATMENAEEESHLFARETLLDLQYNAASILAADQKFNLIVTYGDDGRAHFDFNSVLREKSEKVPTDIEVSSAQVNKTNARENPPPSIIDTPPEKITKTQIESASPELVEMYLEHHYSSLVASVDSWPEKLKKYNEGKFYKNALRSAELIEWGKLDTEAQEQLEEAFNVYYSPEEMGTSPTAPPISRPLLSSELKALYRKYKQVDGLELNEIIEKLRILSMLKQLPLGER